MALFNGGQQFMKTILVTGATGFAGSNFTRWADEIVVRQSANDLQPAVRIIKQGRRTGAKGCYLCDLSQSAQTKQLLKETKPDVIFHFAGCVPYAQRQTPATVFNRDNALVIENLVEATQASGKQPHIIFPSTAALYKVEGIRAGTESHAQRTHFAREETAQRAEELASPYAKSKALAELALRTYTGPWTIVRKPTIIGANDRRGSFLYVLAQHVLEGTAPKESNLQRCSDYLHMDDASHALWGLMDNQRTFGRILNIGSGQAVTGYAAWAFMRKTSPFPVVTVGDAQEKPQEAYAGVILHTGKHRALTGFAAEKSFEEICTTVWSDIKSRPDPRAYLQAMLAKPAVV